jgi:hypothetical protein
VSRNRLQNADLLASIREKILERNELDLELYDYASVLFEEATSCQDATFRDNVRRVAAENRALPVNWFLE